MKSREYEEARTSGTGYGSPICKDSDLYGRIQFEVKLKGLESG